MEMELGRDRLGKFSFQVRRFFVGCACVPCILAVANHYFEWGLFGKYFSALANEANLREEEAAWLVFYWLLSSL